MPRYEDNYGRREDPRATTVRREVRGDERHTSSRVETRDRRIVEDPRESARSSRTQHDPMDVVDPRDPRMMASQRGAMGDPRGANAGARLEPRPDIRHGGGVVSSRSRDEPAYDYDHKPTRMVDSRGVETYPSSREPVSRYASARDDRMDTDMDMAPPPVRRSAAREVVDSRGDYVDEDHRNNRYNDYFVPGPGIDREVIQHEICRYLGNDATVRPYTNPKDGRTGYLVRAYRALTSAMIEDLKRDSARWRQDQDRRSRSGRSTVSYAEMKGRQEQADFGDTMEVDEYPYEAPSARHRDIDTRDPRSVSGRHGTVPVSSAGYVQDPHPAYSIGPGQPGYGSEGIPRYGGNSTPPTSRTVNPGYGQAGYQGRSSAATAPPMSAYRDPRTGQVVSGYDTGYPDQGRSRHGR